MIKIAFDVGGVLSKQPYIWRRLISVLMERPELTQVHIISDMYPKEKIIEVIETNGIYVDRNNIHSANYEEHGEICKAILCQELKIDILIDDFIGYVANEGAPIRLLVMPDASRPYYHDDWKTDGSEGNFGRRKAAKI